MSENIENILTAANVKSVGDAEKYFNKEIVRLQEIGFLELEEDEDLSGLSLELRVAKIFRSIGIDIEYGRNGLEDFIINQSADSETKDNIVVEVKSAKGPNPKLDDLRQLDDWVFDLSGEEQARKQGLGGGLDTLAMATRGFHTKKSRHPNPHKGVFIFNGPVGKPFEQRVGRLLHPNHVEFAEKRNFCVIAINDLVELSQQSSDTVIPTLLSTVGEYVRA